MSAQPGTLKKALALLDAQGRRQIVAVIVMSCAAALSTAIMIASLMPFLTVLARPSVVNEAGIPGAVSRFLNADTAMELLTWLGLISITLLLVSSILRILNVFMIAQFNASQKRQLGRKLLKRYFHRPYTFHLSRNTADLSANLLSEVDEAFRVAYRPASQLVSSLFTTAAVIAVLAMVNLWVTLAALVLIGSIYAGIYGTIRNLIRRLGGIRAEAIRKLYQCANEGLQGIKEVKVLGREDHYLARYDEASLDERSATMKLRVLVDIPHHIIQTAVLIAVIVFCLTFVSEESLIGTEAASGLVPLVGVFAAAGQRLIPELHAVYAALTTMRYGRAALDRLYADLEDEETEPPESDLAPVRLKTALRLESVSYGYPGSIAVALKDVSLEIRAGERLGIAGHSGAGKSTLADLILGLLPPTSGFLSSDGQRIEGDAVRAWQKSVGYVPQEIFLTDATVIENIALGLKREDIDVQRAKKCLDVAQAADFVAELPEGIETVIGERGVRLSGGQRQRIAIARAIYKGVDLLVFDEATSALDALTEQEVISAMAGLPGELTVILIAHRMTTLDICDRIAVIDGGRVARIGRKADLMASGLLPNGDQPVRL